MTKGCHFPTGVRGPVVGLRESFSGRELERDCHGWNKGEIREKGYRRLEVQASGPLGAEDSPENSGPHRRRSAETSCILDSGRLKHASEGYG